MNYIWKSYVYTPPRGPISDLSSFPVQTEIYFLWETQGFFLSNEESWLGRYFCGSCYAAGGSRDDVFATTWEKILKDRESPSVYQQKEMSEHTKQHSLIWAWAQSLEKK